jgi:hypothetical protein
MLDRALSAASAGLCVVPPKNDGSKAPFASWREFMTTRTTDEQLRSWYADDKLTGIGAVLGRVSQNTELLEFDDVQTYERYVERAMEAGLGDLITKVANGYSERTPNGVHWLYRCDVVEGNTKLAQRLKSEDERKHAHDNYATLIETRGEGGFVILAPSHGSVHPSGKPYEMLHGDYATIATITPDEREQLFALARTFDATPRREEMSSTPKAIVTSAGEERPGDYFNRTRSWQDVLEPHGWKTFFVHGKETYWTRPGREKVVSASTNYADTDLLKVFSTSTAFDTQRTYSKFGAYALLNHDGSFVDAARVVRAEMGYTAPPTDDVLGTLTPAPLNEATTSPTTASKHLERLRSRLLDATAVINLPPPVWLIEGVLVRDSLAVVWGASGNGKSFLAIDFALCVATRTWWKNHAINEATPVLYVAAEGAAGLGKRIRAWSKANNVRNLVKTHWLADAVNMLEPEQFAALLAIANETKPGLIVIDTLARSIPGADENAAQDMGRLVECADKLKKATGACVLFIHHATKEGSVARGSGALRAGIDTEIEVRREGDAVLLFCRKQKDAEPFNGISLHMVTVDDSLVLSSVSRDRENWTPDSQALETVRELFCETFSETGVRGAELRNVIETTLPTSRATAYRLINELVATQFIANNGKGNNAYYVPGLSYYEAGASHVSSNSHGVSKAALVRLTPPPSFKDGASETSDTTNHETDERWRLY